MGCHCLLQGTFPTQESNPGPLHCRQVLYRWSQEGSPNVAVNLPPQTNATLSSEKQASGPRHHPLPLGSRPRPGGGGPGRAGYPAPSRGPTSSARPWLREQVSVVSTSEPSPRPHPTFISLSAWHPGPSQASGCSFKLQRHTCSNFQLG